MIEPDILKHDLDDDLLGVVQQKHIPQIKVYQFPYTAVVLGRGSKVEEELNLDACLRDEVSILKRRGGGTSVVLDRGNVVVSVALPLEGLKKTRRAFDFCSDLLIGALGKACISGIYPDGVSDLVLEGRKVAGSCVWRARGLFYFTASILAAPRLELISRYLKHPPREPEYRNGRTHMEFVRSIFPQGNYTAAKELAASLNQTLSSEKFTGLIP